MDRNRLGEETSPYLLQHRDNPVHWQAWGDAALAAAKAENKPILLSIGYAACHWCHVMAHESFENSQIADQMNRDFVCIKVDREERPDVDQLVTWEINREMTTRIAWKPYMFNQAMPHLISAVTVPTLVVWGKQNRVVPRSCGERYQQAMPKARLEVIDGANHYLEVEKHHELAQLTKSFIGGK